jgi:outer membrane protein assembly factor BamB
VLVCGFVLLAAGCGGGKSSAPTSSQPSATATAATTATTPKQHHSAPRLRKLALTVIDGDTGRPLPGAVATAPGAFRRGRALLTKPKTRELTVTVWAPHYGSSTTHVELGSARKLTLRLYRTDGQWLLYGGDAARTQTQEQIHLRPPFHVVWARYLGSLIEYPAVIDDGTAYLNNLDGHLFALSMSTGRTLWEVNMHSSEQDSSPGVVGTGLIAHVKSGRVIMVDRATGRLRWRFPTSGEIESSPVVQDGIDYLGDWAGDIYALDLHTHKPKWVYHDGCKVTASMAISGNLIFFGDYCGRVLALRKTTGKLVWSASAGGAVYGTSAVADGRVYVPSRDGEALYAFTTGGQYLWHVSTGDLVYSAPAVSGGRVYFGSYTGELYCVSAHTGEVLWQIDVGGPISGSPTVIDGIVYVGSFAHRIVGASARTGHIVFRFPHGEYVAVSGNRGRLLLYGWATLWAVEPRG